MGSRWRGRYSGPAVLAVLLALPLAVTTAFDRGPSLVVRGPDGDVVLRIPLPRGEFALRYRNSLYRSPVEERYVVTDEGKIALDELAATELAVLEEYYVIEEPAARSSAGTWEAAPARAVVLDQLVVAATDLGRRSVLVDGRSQVELWRLVEDDEPSVTLEIER